MKLVLPAGLLLVSLGLGAGICYALVAPYPPEPVFDRAVTLPALPHETAYAPPPKTAFAIINARPAFSPDRQPVAEPAATGSEGDTRPPPDMVLNGVIISSQKSIALFNRSGSAAMISATTDQVIDGWRLVHIAPDGVLFRAGVTDYEIKLRSATAGGLAAGQAVVARGQPATPPTANVPPPAQAAVSAPETVVHVRPRVLPVTRPTPEDQRVPQQSEMKIIGLPKVLPKPPTFEGKR